VTFEELRAQFPSAEKCIHLNHAGTSPIARPVADAVEATLSDLMSENSLRAYIQQIQQQGMLRAALGRMLGVAPETLGFVRNTSHGLAIAADALPFAPGDSVVLPAVEYPANVYPWMAQAHRGVEVRRVPPRADDLMAPEDLFAACDGRTRVLAVSWVQWGTGQRLDLARIGAFCRERGIVFAVDLVQGLGALRPDLSLVDIAASGCHKWLLAPGGLGVLYVRPEVLATLRPVNMGWNSVTDSTDWERIHFDLRPGTARFEEGTFNLLGTAALGASVALLEEAGFAAVEARVLATADYARDRLAERGCRVVPLPEPDGRSGIIAFRHPTLPNDTVLAALTARGVLAAVRGGNVRFAPHAYNNEEDVDRAMAAIPD
jgi:cysteine desulfurase/selenocysteine lyase